MNGLNAIVIEGKVYELLLRCQQPCSSCDLYKRCYKNGQYAPACVAFGYDKYIFRFSQSLTDKINNKITINKKSKPTMKFTASKWPVSFTYEINDDFFDGINDKYKEVIAQDLSTGIEDAAQQAAKQLILGKGILLAKQQLDRNSNDNSHE